jgi:hypothetical protein
VEPLVVVRPPVIRYTAAATLAIIIAWAAISPDRTAVGVLAYPAVIALQTAREWGWRLEVGQRGLRERQGVGGTREIPWKQVTGVVLPDAAWWRINPILQVEGAPNVQLTASDQTLAVIEAARRKGRPLTGTVDSVSVGRSLTLWAILLGLASLLLGAEIAARV